MNQCPGSGSGEPAVVGDTQLWSSHCQGLIIMFLLKQWTKLRMKESLPTNKCRLCERLRRREGGRRCAVGVDWAALSLAAW